ncbi:hypothetical protein A2U01_0060929, partial [Trifolium medium]|nr:hypothetical protein [Trifolium medium]
WWPRFWCCGDGSDGLVVVSFLTRCFLDCTRAVRCVFDVVVVAATDLRWSGGGGCDDFELRGCGGEVSLYMVDLFRIGVDCLEWTASWG